MNYLTNYYKNLSEQLQEKVNILESYLQQINEDLEPGTIVQGYGSSNTSTTTNQNDSPELNSFLQAWGSSDPTYDYNRDGVVDGNDLGIFLSRMVDRGGSSPSMMASTAARGTPGLETPTTPSGGSKRMTALDQPGTEKSPFPGTYNAGAGAQTPRNVTGKSTQKKGSGANLGQEMVAGTPSAPRPKSPTQPTQVAYGDEVTNVLRNKIETPSDSTGKFTTKSGTKFDGDLNGNGYDYEDFLVFMQGFNRGANSSDPDWDLRWAQWDYNGDGILNADDLGYWSSLLPPTNDEEEEEGETEQSSPRAPVNQMKTTDAGLENVEFRGRTQQKRKR